MVTQAKFKTGTKEYYLGELARLKKADISKASKDAIETFLKQYGGKKELSYHRLYFHCNNLRLLAKEMGDKFLEPSTDDIISALSNQRDRGLGDWSIEGLKASIKSFYKELGKEDLVQDIKYKNKSKVNRKKKPDWDLAEEEVDLLVQAADNERDKSLISLLYYSGIRIGELLTLRIKDVVFDDAGMIVTVAGKTGIRPVRVLGDAIGYMRSWMNVHPDQFNENAWLYCGIGHDMRGKLNIGQNLEHATVYAIFRKTKNRAVMLGFPKDKRLYPHLFRHVFASRMAQKLTEPVLEKLMGWEYSSTMPKVYLHLRNDQVDAAVLEANGIAPQKKPLETRKPKICINCKTPNPSRNSYCLQCGRPLSVEESQVLNERLSLVGSALKSVDIPDAGLLDEIKDDPDVQAEITRIILKKYVGTPMWAALQKEIARQIGEKKSES